ncbi:MAG: SRPBCC family protein [Gammaproteobacteria bacterium]
MHEVITDIEIEAMPEQVWSILVDIAAHNHWNPFTLSDEGFSSKVGQLTVTIQSQDSKSTIFRTNVLVATLNHEMRWFSRLFLPGIFDGEHYFRIESIGPGRVRFTHGEKFSGILVAFARSGLDGKTKANFAAMNRALKSRAESFTKDLVH